MAILNYFIWNGSPEIFSVGTFALRWYGLFFALGFLISQQILYHMYKKEGKPEKDVDTLTIYMVIATIIGARLGHVIFYQPEIILEDPVSIFLPFEFSPFRFTGLQGLASHGGAFGILFALWLYSRKKKPGQNYLHVLDRIVILVALTGALIRLGNYFNSEIIGKPTDNPLAVVFVNRLTEAITDERLDRDKIIQDVVYHRNDSVKGEGVGRIPLSVYVFFKPGTDESKANNLMEDARDYAFRLDEFFDPTQPMDYAVAAQKDGTYAGRLQLTGIARHPAQLYESISCILLFLWLFWIWNRYKQDLPQGRIFGIFMVVLWSLRFAYEYLKEPQVDFETELPLFMGQILSIPLVIAGILILIYSYKKEKQSAKEKELALNNKE
jgi:phosphatidylglycerol---prolipoprotein diacylglyceryl transferase